MPESENTDSVLIKERSWWYEDADTIPDTLNFAELYQQYNGTILFRSDCGKSACGNAACCRSNGPNSYIYFLPGELEFQQKQSPKIPFKQISSEFGERLHCDGNKDCVYHIRPLDCRSYPFFPCVENGVHLGYFDARSSHNCPLNEELRSHLHTIHQWWSTLLLQPKVLEWAELCGENCKFLPIVASPPEKQWGREWLKEIGKLKSK